MCSRLPSCSLTLRTWQSHLWNTQTLSQLNLNQQSEKNCLSSHPKMEAGQEERKALRSVECEAACRGSRSEPSRRWEDSSSVKCLLCRLVNLHVDPSIQERTET